jgi:hypothetical protein
VKLCKHKTYLGLKKLQCIARALEVQAKLIPRAQQRIRHSNALPPLQQLNWFGSRTGTDPIAPVIESLLQMGWQAVSEQG